ncbi:hypothetical protein ACEQPO_05730 [Bacillus sp. SL00103]
MIGFGNSATGVGILGGVIDLTGAAGTSTWRSRFRELERSLHLPVISVLQRHFLWSAQVLP